MDKLAVRHLRNWVEVWRGREPWNRPPPTHALSRDEPIFRLAVAKSNAGRAWKLISVTIPKEGESVAPDTIRRSPLPVHLEW